MKCPGQRERARIVCIDLDLTMFWFDVEYFQSESL